MQQKKTRTREMKLKFAQLLLDDSFFCSSYMMSYVIQQHCKHGFEKNKQKCTTMINS